MSASRRVLGDLGARVRGVGGPGCEGQYVYVDSRGGVTLAGDDRRGQPEYVVEHFVYTDRCELRAITEAELARWRRTWRT